VKQLIKYNILTEANALAAIVVRNFLTKGFIKKGLNSRLVKHVNKFIKNVHLYVRVSAYIISIASRSAYIVETAAITITSDSALKALKVSLTTLIS